MHPFFTYNGLVIAAPALRVPTTRSFTPFNVSMFRACFAAFSLAFTLLCLTFNLSSSTTIVLYSSYSTAACAILCVTVRSFNSIFFNVAASTTLSPSSS